MLLPRDAPPLNSLGVTKAPRGDARASSPCRAASTARWWRRCWPRRATTWSGSRCSSTTTARRWRRKGACCAGRDIHDARRVAEAMGFPHYVLDYENRFREAVVDEFADAYLAGATPVPCIRCNERVKFRDLLETARDLEADCMATGHYVRRVDGAARAGAAPGGRPGARPELFPLLHHAASSSATCASRSGGLASKAETRALAARYGLPVAEKPDSQDICFVPNGSYAAVIEKLRPGRGGAGRDRASRRAGARAARGGDPLHRRPAARARDRRRRAALRGAARRRRRGGWWSARARRWPAGRCRWRR